MRQRYNLSFRREQQRKERTRRIIAIVVIIFVFAAIGTLIYFAINNIDWTAIKNDDKKQTTEDNKSEPVEIAIDCAGDVMVHTTQMTAARDGDGYNFDNSFEYVKPYFEDSDLALVNLETTFGGEPYTGYPMFSAPDQLADALKNAGFDVAITANNHMLDTGVDGVKRTIEVLSDAGIKYTGSVADMDDKNYLVTDVKGVKVGIVAYTYETSYSTGNRTLNGSSLSDEARAYINSYSPNRLDEDIEDIKDSVTGAKEDGAEIIICYFHWGEEYDTTPNENEKKLAEEAANMGADMIFASHQHVVQPLETIKADDDREVPVFYSMGNFISNQREDTVGVRASELGIIAQVKLVYDPSKKAIDSLEADYIPTWVNKYWSNEQNRNVFTIVPLVDGFEDNESIKAAGMSSKAESMLDYIRELMGDTDDSNDDSSS